MVNSVIDIVSDSMFPMKLENADISTQVKQIFPEIAKKYGADAELSFNVNLETNNGKSITFDTHKGVVLGDNTPLTLSLDVLCSNAETNNDVALQFTMNLEGHFNMSIFNFILFPMINQVEILNSALVTDNIGMYAHNYNALFTGVLHNQANDINIKYAKNGFPLAMVNPVFGLLGGLLKDFTVTPYLSENYLYMGWSMYADLVTDTSDLKAAHEGAQEIKQFI